MEIDNSVVGILERKRKYDELVDGKMINVKSIPFQTKKDIDAEKKRSKKEKKEHKKLLNKQKKEVNLKAACGNEINDENDNNQKSVVVVGVEVGGTHDAEKITDMKLGMKVESVNARANKRIRNDNKVENPQKNETGNQDANICDRTLQTDIELLDKQGTSPHSLTPLANYKTLSNFESAGINVYQYAESRAFEIMNLQRALKDAKFSQNGMIFQTLPRHMRRRAASHDIKRIPRSLQGRAIKAKGEKGKPPSRRYKRRPRNLMEEYNRRSKLHSWLETHMWHAKRFKMIDKWGYRLPKEPCDKSFRAIYRASAKSCLLQDKSYIEFIEMVGLEDIIIQGFRRITNSNAINGIQLSNVNCLSGECYGEEIIYVHDSYPYDVVGSVRFIWVNDSGPSNKKLIVICHPTISLKLINEFEVIFDLIKLDDNISKVEESSDHNLHQNVTVHNVVECINASSKVNNINKEIREDVSLNGTVKRCDLNDFNTLHTKVKLVHHKLRFNMFSITGPLSYQILQGVFKANCSNLALENRNRPCSLYNFTVQDPRFNISKKKKNPLTDSKIKSSSSAKTSPSSSTLPFSAIWDCSARTGGSIKKLTDDQINKMRNRLIPGSDLPDKSVEIPVVVMNNLSRSLTINQEDQHTYGNGFDIILPSGWGMPFWVALIYQGARVGGVDSDESISLEALSTYFPTQYPDSEVRQAHVAQLLTERLAKHNRYPPDKRMNYDKLGFKHPFTIPWFHLVEEWKNVLKSLMNSVSLNIYFSKDEKGFYVLREKMLLGQLKTYINGQVSSEGKEELMKKLLEHPDSLILVSIHPTNGGIPKENSTICIPTEGDLELSNNECTGLGLVTEPMHKGYKKDFPYISKKHNILLPNALTIGGNSRWIIGFVQNGVYSYTIGKGKGIGFISSVAFVYLLAKDNIRFLFRNVNSLDYLQCNMDILL